MKASRKAGGSRNALNREIGADGLRDWSFGLFDCFSTSSLCFWATFCPCVVYGQTKQRLRHLRQRGVPLPGGGERFNDHCRVYCCVAVPCFCWVLEMGSRSDIRNRYEIRGDSVRDCLVSLCCRPCGLTQERREIELEEKSLS
ncbi:PLAC8 family-domain-containing protein [Russula compacta]|nr:PLAC8 family-domain-containing protein [Russula compacta]